MGVDRRPSRASNTSPKDPEKKVRGSVGIYIPPALRKSSESEKEELPPENNFQDTPTNMEKVRRTRNTKLRRPDMQVYVPRAKRSFSETPPYPSVTIQTPCRNNSNSSSPISVNNNITLVKPFDDIIQTDLDNSTPDTSVFSSDKQVIESMKDDESSLYSRSIIDNIELKKDEEEIKPIEKQNLKNRRILRSSIISDILVISDPPLENKVQNNSKSKRSSPKRPSPEATKSLTNNAKVNANSEAIPSPSLSGPSVKLNPDECTWDMMFDDSGECLDPSLLEELTTNLGQVSICKATNDYGSNNYIPSDDALSHILEIYDFPAEFKTPDLMNVFSAYKNFEIKWVDDTHALGVFSSPNIAAEVLTAQLPFVKTRPMREATCESGQKARRLQPYKPRPVTCPALARRLVTGALGVRLSTSREEREAEKRILKEAREKKKLAARQKDDAWEGTLTTNNPV